jgi:hypothetical protein
MYKKNQSISFICLSISNNISDLGGALYYHTDTPPALAKTRKPENRAFGVHIHETV